MENAEALRQATALEVLDVLKAVAVVIDKVGDCDDCGPDGEGWQSAELSDAVATVRQFLEAIGVRA